MFSEGVVSKRTKESINEQRANSKFGGIYSKRKQGASAKTKPTQLQKVEDAISGIDYFRQVLLLQNRETADRDLARMAEAAPDGSNETLDSKIEVANDIFQNSTSREYLISL